MSTRPDRRRSAAFTPLQHPSANQDSKRPEGRAPLHCVAIALLLVLPLLFCASVHAQQPAARFLTVDVFVDSGAKPLAAYQVEVTVAAGEAKLVGVEGGEHEAFSQPAYYDPRALQHERVVLAAFNTKRGEELPQGRTRVATLHYQVAGGAAPRFTGTLQKAATTDGRKISATLTVAERKSP